MMMMRMMRKTLDRAVCKNEFRKGFWHTVGISTGAAALACTLRVLPALSQFHKTVGAPAMYVGAAAAYV